MKSIEEQIKQKENRRETLKYCQEHHYYESSEDE